MLRDTHWLIAERPSKRNEFGSLMRWQMATCDSGSGWAGLTGLRDVQDVLSHTFWLAISPEWMKWRVKKFIWHRVSYTFCLSIHSYQVVERRFKLASLCLWSCKDPEVGMIIWRDVCEYARGGSGMTGKEQKTRSQKPGSTTNSLYSFTQSFIQSTDIYWALIVC